MKHRLLSILTLTLLAGSAIASVTIPDLIRMNRLKDMRWWDCLMEDSLYNDPYLRKFPINQSDTIFIEFKDTDLENFENLFVNIWNNTNETKIKIEPLQGYGYAPGWYSLESKHTEFDWYKALLTAWDIDSLRKLRVQISPTIRYYVHRFIITGTHLKIDTAFFYLPGTPFEEYTELERESYLKKLRIRQIEDSIRNADECAFLARRKAFKATQKSLDVSSYATRSIWQRIADWFRSVWEWLFG